MSSMRLQRALARAGVASRRASEELIRAGRVRVNGAVAQLGSTVDPEADEITVGGRRIRAATSAFLALHKPVRYLVSRRGCDGLASVFDLVPEIPGLTYVGRLDAMTSGLLLMTSDGELVHRLTHPRFGVDRGYRVVLAGIAPDATRRFVSGPVIIDGRPVAIHRFRIARGCGRTTVLELTLREGRNRIVRKICAAMGADVVQLIRVRFGPVRLGKLGGGEWRHLSSDEVRELRDAPRVAEK